MSWNNPVIATLVWSPVTVAFYAVSQRLYKRWSLWWLSPLMVAPALILIMALSLHVSYQDYILGTHWLVTLLGPTTVAFAVPIYEQRMLIRRYWPILLVGVVVGSCVALASSWMLANVFDLNKVLQISLLPRSMTTPFAMTVSSEVGGVPELTAVFVVITGVFGAVLGELILHWLPLRSAIARGALFGMGAHGAGVAKAREVGEKEGAIAGLVMIMVGVLNVLSTTLVLHLAK